MLKYTKDHEWLRLDDDVAIVAGHERRQQGTQIKDDRSDAASMHPRLTQ